MTNRTNMKLNKPKGYSNIPMLNVKLGRKRRSAFTDRQNYVPFAFIDSSFGQFKESLPKLWLFDQEKAKLTYLF